MTWRVRGVADRERLKLSAEPDGFGFFGWAERNDERVRVDVLPPEHLSRGDIKLEGQKPDDKAWILYLDGQEFARVERREDQRVIGETIETLLHHPLEVRPMGWAKGGPKTSPVALLRLIER